MNEPTKEQICETILEKLFNYKWYVSESSGNRAMFEEGKQNSWFTSLADMTENLVFDYELKADFFTDLKAIDDLKKKIPHFQITKWNNRYSVTVSKKPLWLTPNALIVSAESEGEALARAVYEWLESEK